VDGLRIADPNAMLMLAALRGAGAEKAGPGEYTTFHIEHEGASLPPVSVRQRGANESDAGFARRVISAILSVYGDEVAHATRDGRKRGS